MLSAESQQRIIELARAIEREVEELHGLPALVFQPDEDNQVIPVLENLLNNLREANQENRLKAD